MITLLMAVKVFGAMQVRIEKLSVHELRKT